MDFIQVKNSSQTIYKSNQEPVWWWNLFQYFLPHLSIVSFVSQNYEDDKNLISLRAGNVLQKQESKFNIDKVLYQHNKEFKISSHFSVIQDGLNKESNVISHFWEIQSFSLSHLEDFQTCNLEIIMSL